MSSDDQTPTPVDLVPPISFDEAFARLVWSEDVEDGMLKNEALPRQDLLGVADRGLSMDRRKLISRVPIDHIIGRQQGKHPAQTALLSQIDHHDIDQVLDEADNLPACYVVADPLKAKGDQPENLAHAQLHSKRNRTRGQANQLRALLIPKFQPPIAVDEYFALVEKGDGTAG